MHLSGVTLGLMVACACVVSFGYGASRGYYYNYPSYRQPVAAQNALRYQRYSREIDTVKSDKVNAKFSGTANQELDETSADEGDEKTLLLKKKLKKKLLLASHGSSHFGGHKPYGGYGNPCGPFGRDASGKPDPNAEQGRFLFDLNVYNVYQGAGGCRGYGGGGFGYGGGYGGGLGGGLGGIGGGGLLSDPIGPGAYPVPVPVRPYAPFATWLSLFAPGVLGAATVPGVPLADPIRPVRPAVANDIQSDPEVDPAYPVTPVRRPVPNRVYYDSAGAPPVTPAQLVGGVATTVNGIIQQLTGQVQPVYQSGYRDQRYSRSSYG